MKEYFSVNQKEKEKIIKKIKKTLFDQKEVIFGFIFGSFLDAPSFRDIDIGVYLEDIKEDEVLNYELKLSKKIAETLNLHFDLIEVKVLNFAPSPFLNNIFKRGQLLFSRDEKILTDLIENTSLDALANTHLSQQSLKELVP